MADLLVLQILQGNTDLANKLYHILCKKDGNIFFSPFSIHAVLSMAYQGAQAETARVLATTLNLPDPKLTAKGYKSVIDSLNSIEKNVLLMAYKIYIRQHEMFLEQFENSVKNNFYSEVEFVDFKDKSVAVKIINEWVEKSTQDKIKNILDENSFDEETALFLINAIYFKGDWFEQFVPTRTTNQQFYLNNGKIIEVEVMKGVKTGYYKYSDDLKAQIAQIPFAGREVHMVIILPSNKNGIKELEKKLAATNLLDIIENLGSVLIDISLPKFKLEGNIELKEIIAETGLGNIFDKDKANFRNMVHLNFNENLCVDKIIQKTFIDVNEWGAEAAAATVVKMMKVAKCGREPPPSVPFIVDHPAIFMLTSRCGESTNILFYGRLSNPKC